MKEIEGNIWKFYPEYEIVIPTNGTVKRDGSCVMGRGLALQAKKRFPELPFDVGNYILKFGNNTHRFAKYSIITFPVKHSWHEKADLNLIKESARKLVIMVSWEVYLPEVGCGNGGRIWEEVKPILSELPDNFTVVHYKH